MLDDRYDVVVVGAGPAGSIAARTAAKQGAKTLLLERDAVIGSPVRCGEAIAARNLKRFVEIQQSWVAAEVDGAVLYAPNGTGVPIVSPDTTGIILERNIFDRYLAETAAIGGARVQSRCDVTGLVTEDSYVTGVIYERFGKRQKISCKVVIAADGVDSRVARWAGLYTNIRAADLESAYQFYLAGLDYDSRYCHFYFGQDVALGGYVWVFPKSPTMASVGIGVCVKDNEAGTAYRKLQEFIDIHYPRAAIVGEMAGGVPVSKPIKVPYGNGILLAGDAARHCNPLTGGGIATAMMAGHQAGITAAEAVFTGNASAKALSKYVSRIQDDVGTPNQRAYRLKDGVANLTDDMLNRTANELMALSPEDRTLKRAFLIGLMNQPSLLLDIIRAFV